MGSFTTFFLGLAISQLSLMGAFIFSNFRHQKQARVLIVFCICLISFLLSSISALNSNPLISMVLAILTIMTPAVLWVFSLLFFGDDEKIPPYGLALIFFYITVRIVVRTLGMLGYDLGLFGYYFGYMIPVLIMLGLSIHVIYMGIEGLKADLIEERRKIRIPFVISMGIVVVFTLLFGALSSLITQLSSSNSSLPFTDVITLVIIASIFFWTLGLNLAAFGASSNVKVLLQNSSPIDLRQASNKYDAPTCSKEDKLMEKINEAMDEQKLYHETGFTIAMLAHKLSTSEHRLRATINRTLGFRNFNQFLNYYRIREAKHLVAETEEPIANIAMEVGYNSLSSFNKAFKESLGLPPRKFRLSSQA
ncbi:MAG: hypothetical protein COA96_00235 [SAR86 cluster bacterium]|uniref:HTH araC/xylS-type domain-containing protein n=1 Tax=SAR86 cluster bacterium TaxID=2030880 RepID=A0A2A5BAR0_9GAMM|nr:MAG: hypothetical protein COA96_00235 [SAR86 cluster bacterium]